MWCDSNVTPLVHASLHRRAALSMPEHDVDAQVDHELRELSQDDLLQFYSTHLVAASKQRRRLAVHVCSQLPPSDGKASADGHPVGHEHVVNVVDLAAVKAKLPLAELQLGKVTVVNRADATVPGFE